MTRESQVDPLSQAQRLITLRRLLGFSQRQLAEEFNVTPGAIANWESGTRSIPGAVIRLIEIYEENLGMIDRPKVLEKINADWASRTFRSGLTSAKIATKLAAGSLRHVVAGNERAMQIKAATDRRVVQEFIQTAGELKGLLTKVGQMMVYMNFALPKEIRVLLESLQDNTTPMSPDTVDRIFRYSFGASPEVLFKEWEPEPFAAASIGQVHRAVLPDGTKVAVKVQYPEIVKALKSDLRNARVIERFTSLMFRNQDKKAFVDELRERLLEECDYELELRNMELFREIYADNPHVVIPKPFPEFSRVNVLTTEYVRGQRFREFSEQATQAERNHAGQVIFEFTFKSIFKHQVFNCDPNAGNFLFDGNRVVFLDFGCVKRYDDEFIRDWKELSAASLERDKARAFKLGKKVGLFPVTEGIDFDYQFESMLLLYEPWLEDREYQFSQDYVEGTWRKFVMDNPDRFKLALPKDWVFTNRLQWGVAALLAELQAADNWHRRWREYTDFEEFKSKK